MRTLTAVCVLFLFTLACAAGPKTPQVLDFSPAEIREVALAPVVFADTPIDRHFGVEVANRIQREAQQTLREKGYDVRIMEAPHAMQVPTVARDADMVRIAPAIPAGADGVVVIRIDHFFDTGTQDRMDRMDRIPLELHGTAALVTPGGSLAWRDQGVGKGIRSSRFDTLEVIQVSSRLVESLFRTLPRRAE